MPSKPEWQLIGESIIKTHDGQQTFCLKEAAKILGCGHQYVAGYLDKSGITVKRQGKKKTVTAYDLGVYLTTRKTRAV